MQDRKLSDTKGSHLLDSGRNHQKAGRLRSSDIKALLENLIDLEDISKVIDNEFRFKNQILETGLRECYQCRNRSS